MTTDDGTSLRIVVAERETACFGASGRNGGWCSALFPASWHRMTVQASRSSVIDMQAALEDAVDEVGRVAAAEAIDCDSALGGSVALARGPAQLHGAKAEVEQARSWGFGPDTLDLLSAGEALRRMRATRTLGAVTTAHCAALQPAVLARGLAQAAQSLGVVIHEHTAALEVSQRHRGTMTVYVRPTTTSRVSTTSGRRVSRVTQCCARTGRGRWVCRRSPRPWRGIPGSSSAPAATGKATSWVAADPAYRPVPSRVVISGALEGRKSRHQTVRATRARIGQQLADLESVRRRVDVARQVP